MMRHFFPALIFIFLFISPGFTAQTRKIDSVRALLKNAKDDKTRLAQLKIMSSYQKWLTNLDSAIWFGEQAAEMAIRLKAKTDLCDIYGNLGLSYNDKGKHPKALELFLKSLQLAEETGDKLRAADNYIRIGSLYDEQSEYDKAIKNYFTALSVYTSAGRKDRVSMTTGNIGNVYYSQKKFDKALELYLKALSLDEELNNKENMKYSLGYIGMVYSQLAKKNTFDSDSLYRGSVLYYQRALRMATELRDQRLMINWLGNLGVAYTDLKKFGEAERSLLRAVKMSDSLGLAEEKIQFENAVSELYYLKGDYKQSIDHYRIYTREKDSIFNAEKDREITRHEMNYEFEKKMARIKTEQEKKEAAAAATSRQQKVIIISVIGGFAITLIAMLVILKTLRTTRLQKNIIEKQKQLVDEKQKEIIDSINYARRIQHSLLANEAYINKNIKRLSEQQRQSGAE